MARIKVGLQVEEKVLAAFKEVACQKLVTPSNFVEGCMRAYSEGKFKFSDGAPSIEPQIITVGAEHRAPGRPPKEKEPVGITPTTKPPFKHDIKLDWWEHDFSNATYEDMPPRTWEEKEHARDTKDWIKFDTKGIDEKEFELCVGYNYLRERPKVTVGEDIIGVWYPTFLSRVALLFVSKNGYSNYGFSLKDNWEDALIMQDVWDRMLNERGVILNG